MKNIFKLSILSASLLLISACGGSSGQVSSSSNELEFLPNSAKLNAEKTQLNMSIIARNNYSSDVQLTLKELSVDVAPCNVTSITLSPNEFMFDANNDSEIRAEVTFLKACIPTSYILKGKKILVLDGKNREVNFKTLPQVLDKNFLTIDPVVEPIVSVIKPTIVIPNALKEITLVENSQSFEIAIKVFDDNAAPYTKGNVKVKLPPKALQGKDVGSFSSYEVAVNEQGLAIFNYTGPSNLKVLEEEGDLNSIFRFYHVQNSQELKEVKVIYSVANDVYVPVDYSLSIENEDDDFSMSIPNVQKKFLIKMKDASGKNIDPDVITIEKVEVSTQNPLCVLVLDPITGEAKKSVTLDSGNFSSFRLVSKKLSGIAPIKVVIDFIDENKEKKQLSTLANITIKAVNNVPIAQEDSVSTNKDTPITIDVLLNDSDIDDDPLSITSLNAQGDGTVSITDDNKVLYTPASNFSGNDSFTYAAYDGTATSNVVTVNVTVEATDDALIYYIDSENGDDSNNGLSESTAWKHINKYKYVNLEGGEKILLKRGSVFNEAVDIYNQHDLTIGAYGNGAKPTIIMMEKITNNWTKYPDNIWKTTLENHPHRLLKNGKEILRANSLKYIDGEIFFWEYDKVTKLLSIYSEDKPSNILAPSTGKVLLIYKSKNINISDIEVIGGRDTAVGIIDSSRILLNNMKIGKYSRNGIKLANSRYVNINNSDFDAHFDFNASSAKGDKDASDHGPSNGIQVTGTVSESNIANCRFKNWNHASIDIWAEVDKDRGIHENIHHMKIHDNFMTAPDIVYGGRMGIDGNAHDIKIYDNLFENIAVRNQINGHDNNFFHNIINKVRQSPLKDDVIGQGLSIQAYSGKAYNNIIRYNIIANTDSEGIFIPRMGNYKDSIYDNNISNNIIYNCGKRINHIAIVMGRVWANGSSHDNFVKNNLVYDTSITANDITTILNNHYLTIDEFNGEHPTIDDGISHSVAIASGNFFEDPKFKHPDNLSFKFKAGSIGEQIMKGK